MSKKSSVPRGTKAYKKRQRGASHAGFHYHNLYQCCQMKWFIKYVLRIDTKHTSTPLINGAAFHEGKATFYTSGSRTRALNKIESEIKNRRTEFENEGEYQKTLDRAPVLLDHWINKFGYSDLKRFNVVDVEKELTVRLPGTTYVATVRPDAILEEKSGDKDWYGMETKTSSFSVGTTEMGVHYGDQSTIYAWAVRAHYGRPLYAILPDIAYWNKQAKDESNIKIVRGDLIQRSERRIAQFTAGLVQLQNIMAQKIEAYKRGADPYMLFQRNTHYCTAFSKPCEYAEICDNDLTKVKRLPPGFKRDRTLIKPKPTDYVEDDLAGLL